MATQEKGDPDNLTGNLIVYSKFKSINEDFIPVFMDEDIISLYLTSDRKNFIDKGNEIGAPREYVDLILNKADSYLNSKKEIKDLEEILLIYSFNMPPCSERVDLPIGSYDDVIFCGEYQTMKECIKNNADIAKDYIDVLKDQFIRKDNDFSISDLEKKSMPLITYRDIDKSQRGRHIIDNYIIPMDRAIKQGSKTEFNTLKRKFISLFSYGYKPIDDFIDITNLIEKQVDGNLISLYLNKICKIKN